jgi:acyl-CoA synthetase (AMP-forming)/AMP-acid ligase II
MLSAVLDATASACADAPCCVLVFADDEHGGTDDGDEIGSKHYQLEPHTSPRCLSALTYRDALQAQKEHAAWLRDLLLVSSSSGDPPLDGTAVADHGVLYLAYLSSNDVDLFLSVLACSSLGIPQGRSDSAVLVMPTLLNTRWTTAEMARALRPKAHATAGIVYSAQYETQARDLAQRLRRDRLSRACVPIPHFSRKHFTPSTLPDTYLPRNAPYPSDSAVLDKIKRLANGGGGGDRNRTTVHRDAVILFTSGTSSSKGAKGVRLSHRALVVQGLAKLLPPGSYSHRTVLLATTVPFYHVGGLSSILSVWMAGGCLALPAASSSPPLPSFDPLQVFRSIRTAQVNTLVVVPAMLHALMTSHEGGSESSLMYPHVRCVLIGGQSASDALLRYCRAAFPNASLVQTYACTEAASSITFRQVGMNNETGSLGNCRDVTPSPGAMFAGDCVGTPPPHVEVVILPLEQPIDETTDNSQSISNGVRRSGVGVIVTRGPHVMNGYWDSSSSAPPSRSSSPAPRSYDWHVTGDLGRIDEHGQLWFCGRVADSIRTGGETVMANEVERVLLLHPHIADVAVFPLPDDKFGQAVGCAIVLCRQRCVDGCTDQAKLVQVVREWCEQNGVAGYKRPKQAFVVNDLPKNASGKTLKYLLVERFSRSGSSVLNSKL